MRGKSLNPNPLPAPLAMPTPRSLILAAVYRILWHRIDGPSEIADTEGAPSRGPESAMHAIFTAEPRQRPRLPPQILAPMETNIDKHGAHTDPSADIEAAVCCAQGDVVPS